MFLLSAVLALAMQTAPEPRRMMITVPGGVCRVIVNGKPVTMTKYRRLAMSWRENEPEVHFRPDRDANYICVDRALRVIRDANLTRVGFVGNELHSRDSE